MALNKIVFEPAEYSLLGTVVFCFLCIYVYYGFIRKKYRNEIGYIFGGKNVSVKQVAITMITSHITTVTLLGIPVDIYKHGMQYSATALAMITVSLVSAYVYIPVFYKLQLNSIFEYLEIRFSPKIRGIASMLFISQRFLLLLVPTHVAARAFDRSFSLWIGRYASIVCCACAMLCSFSGLRGVCATSLLAAFVGACAAFAPGAAVLAEQGPRHLWNTAMDGGRIVFFDPDPNFLRRTSFAAVMIGLTTLKLFHLGTSQDSIQQLSGLSSLRHAKKAVFWHAIGVIVVQSGSCLTGLAMYSWYAGCDPLLSKKISRFDQMLPLFLSELGQKYPGVPGIFSVGVFCAAVSSMGLMINSLTVVIYEDFLRFCLPTSLIGTNSSRIMQTLSFVIGILCMGINYRVHDLTRVMHIASGFTSITAGLLLGLFTLGIVFPRANSKGAMCGILGGLLLCACAVIGTLAVITDGKPSDYKTMTTDKCHLNNSSMGIINMRPINYLGNQKKTYFLFRFSFMYCAVIGVLTVIIIALPISCLTRSEKDAELNPDLFCPLVRYFVRQTSRSSDSSMCERDRRRKEKERQELEAETTDAYSSLDQALKHLKDISEV